MCVSVYVSYLPGEFIAAMYIVLLHINSRCSLNSSAADRNEKSLLSAETKFENGVDAGRINWTRFYQAAACIEHQNNIVKSVEKDTDIIRVRA